MRGLMGFVLNADVNSPHEVASDCIARALIDNTSNCNRRFSDVKRCDFVRRMIEKHGKRSFLLWVLFSSWLLGFASSAEAEGDEISANC